ncbi:MAG: cupin domain-containing protein, partial [Candidatus Eisenbacteria bacterium]|nr:cupin domain-containing protein [Candidatus Eisenbacteria bacterium]
KGAWQRARSLGEWTLVGCTVSPAFQFDGFELAPPDADLPG